MAFSFSDILKKAASSLSPKSLFGGGKGHRLGVDIGTSTIKVVEIQSKNKKAKQLVKYGSIALGPYAKKNIGEPTKLPNDKLAEAIQTLLSELFPNVDRHTMSAFFSVPLKASLLTVIEIPKVPPEDLDRVVKLEARKYIPFPHEEVTINWLLIPEYHSQVVNKEEKKPETDPDALAKEKIHVMVVAIHNNTVAGYQELAKLVGFKRSGFEVEVFSIIRSIIDEEDSLYAIADIGSDSTKIAVVDGGHVIASHTVNQGSQMVTDALSKEMNVPFAKAEEIKRHHTLDGKEVGALIQKVVEPVLSYGFFEMKQALDTFERNSKKKITKVYMVGGGAMLAGIAGIAGKTLGKEVVLGEPFRKVDPPAEILKQILKDESPEFAVASGLALRAIDEL